MKTIKAHITCWLIRLAMRTCVYGFTHDYLTSALRQEKAEMEDL